MSWIEHVKQYQKENGCSYKEALIGAKGTYVKKTSGAGLRTIARKMHGKGCEISGGGNSQSGHVAGDIAGWSVAGAVALIAITLVLKLFYPPNTIPRISPDTLDDVRRDVQHVIRRAGHRLRPDVVIHLVMAELRNRHILPQHRALYPQEMEYITTELQRQIEIERDVFRQMRRERNARRVHPHLIPEQGEEETRVAENV